jgi:Fuc2NAc and GlcNAc transferase
VYKIFAAYIFVLASTYCGVEMFRRWSLRREILDIPNNRSLHTTPIPRGGGLVIFLVSALTFLVYTLANGAAFYWAYFGGAAIVAVISLLDDVKPISPFLRILFHSLAAALVVWSLGGFREVSIPFYGVVETGWWGVGLTFLWIVWLINSYNFMDGIDGIAAMQAITAGAGWCLTGWLLGIEEAGFFGGVLAMSALGFRMLNWQPAKIFMGDVGSAFLGYSFAVLPLLALHTTRRSGLESSMPWIAVLLVWFFVFDSVFTFLKRLVRGEKVWEAHREHIYQKMVLAGMSHRAVTCFYGIGSALTVLFLCLALKYSHSLNETVLNAVLCETILLIAVWQIVVRAKSGSVGVDK